MKIISVLTMFFALLLSPGCENSVEEEEFPFEFRLVIRGVIEPNKAVSDIYIGKTMPISSTFSQGFADVTDAAAVILHKGVFFPLRHTARGLYRNDTLIVRAGETYQLFVQWEDKLATAETTVPLKGVVSHPVVKSINGGNSVKNFVECNIASYSEEVYAASWVVLTISGSITQEDSSIAAVVKRESNGSLVVSTAQIPSNFGNQNLGMHLFIYDASFYDYYYSQGSNRTSDLVFGQPQNNIKWNVAADGIGMFIGRRDTLLKVN